eukprot:jgi/Bigna1/63840/fgenesh1_kg.61_\
METKLRQKENSISEANTRADRAASRAKSLKLETEAAKKKFNKLNKRSEAQLSALMEDKERLIREKGEAERSKAAAVSKMKMEMAKNDHLAEELAAARTHIQNGMKEKNRESPGLGEEAEKRINEEEVEQQHRHHHAQSKEGGGQTGERNQQRQTRSQEQKTSSHVRTVETEDSTPMEKAEGKKKKDKQQVTRHGFVVHTRKASSPSL